MSINVAAIPSPFIHATIKRRKNTWYTIASGNWSDPNIWMSNSRRRYGYPSYVLGGQNANATIMPQFPSANDDVFINHSVVLDVSTTTAAVTVNNLYISGSLTMNNSSARGITVVGDLQVNGSVDISGAAHTLALYGVNNYINSFASGTTSTVNYMRAGDQYIMDLSYRNLGFFQSGTKYLTNNLNIAGNLASQALALQSLTIECLTFNLTVSGTTSTNGGVISKTGSGSLLFVGQYSFSTNAIQGVSFSGNPTVEFRGGINVNGGASIVWNTGTSTWSFTTNAQTVSLGTITYSWTAPISIIGAITVNEAGTGIMSLNQPIDCTSASGSVVAKGTIYFNSTSSLPSFTTGTFDRTSFANTVGYTMGASITLPYTSYSSLLVANSGIKTAIGDTAISGNLTLNNSLVVTTPTMEMGAFNLTVTGTTLLGTTNTNATLSKTGAGNILFTGAVTVQNSNQTGINFTGNPTVEVRGGMIFTNNSGLNFGSGGYTFSTNSQSITASGACNVLFASAIISGSITVTANGGATSSTIGFATNPNGTVTGSILKNQGWIELFELPTNSIMATGQFDTTTVSTNGIAYSYNGDYVLPMTTYGGLYLKGTGTKTVSANMTLNSVLIVGARSVFELGTSNLSVASTTTIELLQNTSIADYYSGLLKKSGAGNILFAGNLNLGNANNDFSVASLDFSAGNPAVELRGGITSVNTALPRVKTGTGTWTFSMNNQTLSLTGANAFAFDSNIIISGAITLTASSTNAITFKGNLNGNNAASTFDNRGIVQYQATQQPMLTGVLQTNLAANTFLYNGNNSQNITGGTYRTLTLGGTATPNNKTLQGNIVVATAYSTTGNAVLVLNSFTKT